MSRIKRRILILNSKKDTEFVSSLKKELQKRPIDVWIPFIDLIPGQNIRRELEREIYKSFLILILLSKACYNENRAIKQELLANINVLKKSDIEEKRIYIIKTDDNLPSPEGFEDTPVIQLNTYNVNDILKGLSPLLSDTDYFAPEQHIENNNSRSLWLDEINRDLFDRLKNNGSSKKESKQIRVFLEKLYEQFYSNRAILLFNQDDWLYIHFFNNTFNHAKSFFGEKNVLHIIPPSIPDIDATSYFSCLMKQCQVHEPVANAFGFMRMIEDRLENETPLLLMISHFEQGNESCTTELAGILRDLNERFPTNFNILICGGEKLARMYFQGGSLSLLNHAEVMEWPELTIEDICLLFPEKELNEKTAENLLKISGGHPRIIEKCLDFYRPGTGIDEAAIKNKAESNFSFIANDFTSFASDERQKHKLCDLLSKKGKVYPSQPYIIDPMVRKLYWKNLLTKDEAHENLVWRCDLIRQIGIQAAGC